MIALHDAIEHRRRHRRAFWLAYVVIPPVGYLQRLREICTQNNILLIFDEVISDLAAGHSPGEAFGDARHPEFAKQVTNGAQPWVADCQQGDLRHLHGGRRARVHARVPARLHPLGLPRGVRGGLAALDIRKRRHDWPRCVPWPCT